MNENQDTVKQGKTIIVRIDLNMPVKNKVIKNDAKIVNFIPTLMNLLEENNKVVLISSPDLKVSEYNNLTDVSLRISKHLKQGVRFISFKNTIEFKNSIDELNHGEVMLVDGFEVDSSNDSIDKWQYLSTFGDALMFFRTSNKIDKKDDKESNKEYDPLWQKGYYFPSKYF